MTAPRNYIGLAMACLGLGNNRAALIAAVLWKKAKRMPQLPPIVGDLTDELNSILTDDNLEPLTYA